MSSSGATLAKLRKDESSLGSFVGSLRATDGSTGGVAVKTWAFNVSKEDTAYPEYGPNGRVCSSPAFNRDEVKLDQRFTCACDNETYAGDNCETKLTNDDSSSAADGAGDGDSIELIVVVAVLCVALLGAMVMATTRRWTKHAKANAPVDFNTQLQSMKDRGEVDEAQVQEDRVPRELKRNWLALTSKLGHGAFGDVWKGMFTDGANRIPEYMVACKVVKAASGSLDTAGAAAAEDELLKEALLMAQVGFHAHLVSLVGVVTRGKPKILVLSFCEHGELVGALKKRAADGDAYPYLDKCRFCEEVAEGMAHLAEHNFVHRDLAARNVLLSTGMVCKVADFGLSRSVQADDDSSGDYYRSAGGIIPVRWTAPEGIASQKFSSASDVWSFGVACIEIFQVMRWRAAARAACLVSALPTCARGCSEP